LVLDPKVGTSADCEENHMAGTFKFELVTPERMVIPEHSGDAKSPAAADAEQVVVPGADGQFTVMAGHAPVIAALRPGVLEVKLSSGQRRIFVRGGFAEVEPDRLTVLAQHYVDLDARDRGKIEAELKAAEAMLAEAKDDAGRLSARDAVDALRSLAAAG